MNTSKQTTQSTSTTIPGWAPQLSALTTAFHDALGKAYPASSAATPPTNFTAQMTPEQIATAQAQVGYGNNNTTPDLMGSAGSNMLLGGASGAQGALDQLGAFNVSPLTNFDVSPLTNFDTSSLTNFNPSATNNPNAIAQGARTYAGGIDIPGAVRSAMQSAVEAARDTTLPGMESSAATSGNINSSRTGLEEGIVQRALAEKAANTYSDMWNSAYGTGAGLTENALSGNNNLSLGALTSALSDKLSGITSGLGDKLSGIATGLGDKLQSLTGAGALGTAMSNLGANLLPASVSTQGNLFDIANAGGTALQQGQQANLTNQLMQYNSKLQSPFDPLSQLMGIIGTNNWGSTTNSSGTSTSTPSALQTIGGLMTGAGNLFTGLRLSDREAKEDIVQVGTLFDGQPIYRYRYKGHPAYQIGLMAQDVEKRNPDAVTEFDGYKYVHYLEATKHIA